MFCVINIRKARDVLGAGAGAGAGEVLGNTRDFFIDVNKFNNFFLYLHRALSI